MADTPIIHIGENSPEHVAYKLLEMVAAVDKTPAPGARDRKWILHTYAECLRTVRNPGSRVK